MPNELTAHSYPALLDQIKTAITSGQRHIEQMRALTYWRVGEAISKHLLQNNGRAGYGRQIYKKLAKDLNIGPRTLRRTVQFYKEFPIVSARTQLSWGHYRELIAVADPSLRARLIRKAQRRSLSTRQLAQEIKTTNDPAGNGFKPFPTRLIPQKGPLNIYQDVKPSPVALGPGQLLLDLGFHVRTKVSRRAIEDSRIVTTRAKMSFTYKAYVEEVIDGDTLRATIDLGVNNYVSQKLRLRGLDCPEINTAAGKRAKRYVEKAIRRSGLVAGRSSNESRATSNELPSPIIIRSSKSDKYDRYLADVFVPSQAIPEREATHAPRPQGAGVTTDEYVFLNQELLDAGLATKYSE